MLVAAPCVACDAGRARASLSTSAVKIASADAGEVEREQRRRRAPTRRSVDSAAGTTAAAGACGACRDRAAPTGALARSRDSVGARRGRRAGWRVGRSREPIGSRRTWSHLAAHNTSLSHMERCGARRLDAETAPAARPAEPRLSCSRRRRAARRRTPRSCARRPSRSDDLGRPAEQLPRERDVGPALLGVVDSGSASKTISELEPVSSIDRLGELEQRELVGVADVDRLVVARLRRARSGRGSGPRRSRTSASGVPSPKTVIGQFGERLAQERRDRAAVVRAHPRRRRC